MSCNTSSPKSQLQLHQSQAECSDLVDVNSDVKEDTSTFSTDPVSFYLPPSSFPLHSDRSPSNDENVVKGTNGKSQEDNELKPNCSEDSYTPPENTSELKKDSPEEAKAEVVADKRALGEWNGELEVKAEPLDVDGLVRAPVNQFEKEHQTFQEDIISELYLLVLECELWSKEYNQRLVREGEEEIVQKTTHIRVKEQKQEKSRLSLLKFMNQVRSAMSALVEAIPQSPGSQIDMED